MVRAKPSIHTTLDLKNFAILSIWTLSDILDIIPRTVPIRISGKSTLVIKFPINVIISKRTGWITDAVTKFPSCEH